MEKSAYNVKELNKIFKQTNNKHKLNLYFD